MSRAETLVSVRDRLNRRESSSEELVPWQNRRLYRDHHTSAGKREGRWPRRVARATWRHSQLLLPCRIDCRQRRSPLGGLDRRSVETQLQEYAWIFALDQVVVCMVTTRPPKTIVEPTALGTVANTDSKLLIYRLFQKGRVLAQDGMSLSYGNYGALRAHMKAPDAQLETMSRDSGTRQRALG